MKQVLAQVTADGRKVYAPVKKCTPEQIAQVVKHLASVIKTIQEQQGLDIVLTDWTQQQPDDPDWAKPELVVTFNESFYHRAPPDDEIPF